MIFRKCLHLWLALVGALLLSCCAAYSSHPPVSALPEHYDVAPRAEALTLKNADNLTLFAQWWTPSPAASVKAVIVLVHGTYVHSGFYQRWASHLADHGYAVLGFDMRGWGQSQGRGRRGFVTDVGEYQEDLALAYRQARSRYPDLPVYVQGESLGGLVALLATAEGDIQPDGLILNAPALRIAMKMLGLRQPNWLARSGLWMMALPGEAFPNHPVLMPGAVTELFAGMAVDSEQLVDAFVRDPHVTHTALPLGFFAALKDGTAQAQDLLPVVQQPLLVLQGTDDMLVPLSSSEYLLAHAGSGDKTLRVYDGMSHATLHDTGHEQVWHDILAWLDKRVENIARH